MCLSCKCNGPHKLYYIKCTKVFLCKPFDYNLITKPHFVVISVWPFRLNISIKYYYFVDKRKPKHEISHIITHMYAYNFPCPAATPALFHIFFTVVVDKMFCDKNLLRPPISFSPVSWLFRNVCYLHFHDYICHIHKWIEIDVH